MRMMRHQWIVLGTAAMLAAGGGLAQAQFNSVVFEENFDGLEGSLEDSVNERYGFPLVTSKADDTASVPVMDVFSAIGPAGWVVDNTLGVYQGLSTVGNTGVPGQGVTDYGVDEWQGWGFANKDFWVEAADDQDRGLFTKASGGVAVADPDEYFDLEPDDGETGGPSNPNHGGFYNTSLKTPSVSFTGLGTTTGGLQLKFDSSWRPEAYDDSHPDPAFNNLNNQAVEVIAVFDTGETMTVPTGTWDSDDAGASFKDNMTNETVTLGFLPSNAAATSVEFYFNMANAGNDWWWAIDNIEVDELDGFGVPKGTPVFTENFDGSVAYGDSINERRSTEAVHVTDVETAPNTSVYENAFTHTPPADWTNDNSQVAGVGDPNEGVEEWEGWSFVKPDFWHFAEEGDRVEFTKGTGLIAVADPDEWDDLGDPESIADFDATLTTPTIDITGIEEGELAIAFDATWREEGTQTALLTVDYGDGNGPMEVLRWESRDGDANFFQDDLLNESVLVRLDNPVGATQATFAFRLFDAGNNYWWAIDNIRVGAVPEPMSTALVGLSLLAVAGVRRRS